MGRADLVEELLKRPDKLNIHACGGQGEQALHRAATRNSGVALILLLVAAGADVNCQDEDGTAPLHIAMSNKAIDPAKALISGGAKIDAALIGVLSGFQPIHQAAENGFSEGIQLLLSCGADVNALYNDMTPLVRLAPPLTSVRFSPHATPDVCLLQEPGRGSGNAAGGRSELDTHKRRRDCFINRMRGTLCRDRGCSLAEGCVAAGGNPGTELSRSRVRQWQGSWG